MPFNIRKIFCSIQTSFAFIIHLLYNNISFISFYKKFHTIFLINYIYNLLMIFLSIKYIVILSIKIRMEFSIRNSIQKKSYGIFNYYLTSYGIIYLSINYFKYSKIMI
jgi:hypothetical protein